MATQEISKAIAKRVKDTVQQELESQAEFARSMKQEEEDDELLEGDPFVVEPPSAIKTPTKGIFDSFLSSLGYFGKISKELPDGGWETKDYTINAPETIPDIDQFVVNLVNEKGWGDGKYYVTIRHPAKRGFHLKKSIIVGELTPQERKERAIHKSRLPASSDSPWVDPVESSMKLTNQVLQVAKTMAPPQQDMVQVSTILANTFRSGVDAAKSVSSQTPTPSSTSSPFTSHDGDGIVSLITALKELLRPPEQPKQPSLVEMLATLKELGLIQQPHQEIKESEVTMLEKLKLLKDGLGLKYAHEVEGTRSDPMKMIETVGGLATALRPLINPDASPRSTLELVFEAFSKFGGPLFDTIRDFAEAKKIQAQHQLSQAGIAIPNRIERKSVVDGPPMQPPPSQPTQPGNVNAMLAKIINIVQTKDESQFPFLRQTIFGFMGPQWVAGLISGDVTVDYIVELSRLQFGETFNDEATKLFLYKFIAWLRKGEGKQESNHEGSGSPWVSPEKRTTTEKSVGNTIEGNGLIVAKCGRCGQEWDLSKEEFQKDNHCECGGILSEISKLSAPALSPIP